MAKYEVSGTAYFGVMTTVEADSFDEAREKALPLLNNQAYGNGGDGLIDDEFYVQNVETGEVSLQ